MNKLLIGLLLPAFWVCHFFLFANQESNTNLQAEVVPFKATYYHPNLIGNTMTNGEPFSQTEYTCAVFEGMFPMGTLLKVTNTENGNSVLVEVTDHHDNLTDLDLAFEPYVDLKGGFSLQDSGHALVTIERIQ